MAYVRQSVNERVCSRCNKTFLPNRPFQKYCGAKACGWNATHYAGPVTDLTKPTVGTIGELVAGISLLEKGFQVYRALSPSADCDLLAVYNEHLYRFEVKTGRHIGENLESKVLHCRKNSTAENFIVVTYPGHKVHYFPEPPVPW